jgi:hypothetical protein
MRRTVRLLAQLLLACAAAFGYRAARRTIEEARRGALDNCAKHAPDCRIVIIDEAVQKPAP